MSFQVRLSGKVKSKIQLVKLVKPYLNNSLYETLNFVDLLENKQLSLIDNVSYLEANSIKKDFESIGCQVEIVYCNK